MIEKSFKVKYIIKTVKQLMDNGGSEFWQEREHHEYVILFKKTKDTYVRCFQIVCADTTGYDQIYSLLINK